MFPCPWVPEVAFAPSPPIGKEIPNCVAFLVYRLSSQGVFCRFRLTRSFCFGRFFLLLFLWFHFDCFGGFAYACFISVVSVVSFWSFPWVVLVVSVIFILPLCVLAHAFIHWGVKTWGVKWHYHYESKVSCPGMQCNSQC